MRKKFWFVFIFVSIFLVALDLLLKNWAAANLPGAPEIILIEGVLGLRYVENPGALFGFLKNFDARWVLSALKIIILGGILIYFHRLPTEKKFWFLRAPLILVFAGGVGNLFDRVKLGIVRDMLNFLFVNFAVFNLADVYVTVGVFSLVFVMLFVVKEIP
ncbi:MAG: signal peptidase II [Defluviitaleaceae bacterium]|nr:signal peptidase II [Defluviitaleaceae bacterium]